jgi:hypothetical protein
MNFEFPALAFSQDFVRSIPTLASLSISTKLALRNGYYEELKLVDRFGNLAGIARIQKIRRVPLRSFSDVMEFLGGNSKCEIALELEARPSISLSATKHLIFDSFEKESDMWEEMFDLENFQQRVESAKSFDELFAAFEEFHV